MDGGSLTGKTAVITGAARGLGAAFAVVLADLGVNVVLTGRMRETLGSTAESIHRRTGRMPETRIVDLADAGQVTAEAEAIAAAHPKLDILINNGAQWLAGGIDDYDGYGAANVIAGAVTGTFLITRKLVGPLAASGAGDILNIVSITGLPNARLATAAVPFYMAKHAQAGMSDALRQELRTRPVRVSAIYPPYLDDVSPLDEAAWGAPRPAGALATNRDVVEAGLFALTRPRHVTIGSLVIDPDNGGLWG